MKAQELRIGNLIEYANKICFVRGIVEMKIFLEETDGYKSIHDSRIDSVNPIPLTEEWLVKFGWSYYNGKTSGNLTKDFGGKIDFDFIDGEMMLKSHYEDQYKYRHVRHIEFVHQLQNLYFALTGKELEIKVSSPSQEQA